MVKTLKNLLLQNWFTYFHETWYVALGTPAHHSLFKDDSGLPLTYFIRSTFVTKAFFIGTSENSGYFKTIAACDLKVGRCRQLIVSIKGQGHFLVIS